MSTDTIERKAKGLIYIFIKTRKDDVDENHPLYELVKKNRGIKNYEDINLRIWKNAIDKYEKRTTDSNQDMFEFFKEKLKLTVVQLKQKQKPKKGTYFFYESDDYFSVSNKMNKSYNYVYYVEKKYMVYRTNYEEGKNGKICKATYQIDYVDEGPFYILDNFEVVKNDEYDPFHRNFYFDEEPENFMILFYKKEGLKIYHDFIFESDGGYNDDEEEEDDDKKEEEDDDERGEKFKPLRRKYKEEVTEEKLKL